MKFVSEPVIRVTPRSCRGQLRETMGESSRRRFDLTRDRILRSSADYYRAVLPLTRIGSPQKREKKGEYEGASSANSSSVHYRRSSGLACAARETRLKTGSRSVPRIACARIGSGYPHDSNSSLLLFLLLAPLPLLKLFRAAAFAAESSDFREARMWAGPDSSFTYAIF